MRDLTEAEKGDLRYGCIFCKGDTMFLGPQGGLSFNIYCANTKCLAGFNVTHAKLPWQLIAEPGERTMKDIAHTGKMHLRAFFEHLDRAIESAIRTGFERLTRTEPLDS
jgi:hypothetical protein